MEEKYSPFALTWADVDPSRHPVDLDAVPDVIRQLTPPDYWSLQWSDAITRAMVERFGLWASGWRWGDGDGEIGGGPVRSWCCNSHSISRSEEAPERVATALVEWRRWLEDLAERFDRFPLAGSADVDRVGVWERGAVHLIHHVVECTGSTPHFRQHALVLVWFLDRWGVDEGRARHLVNQAIGGRFSSWVEPDETLVADIAKQLALSLGVGQSGPGHD